MDYKFEDYIKLYQTIEDNEWVTIFEETTPENHENNIFTFCAMCKYSEEDVQEYLSKYDWGFNTDSFGMTTFERYGEDEIEYVSGETRDGFEYLIALRHFDKFQPVYEINPKLIWYGNLHYAQR